MKYLKIAIIVAFTGLVSQLAFATCDYGSSDLPPGSTVCFGTSASNMTVHTCEGGQFVNNGTKCSCANNSPTYDYDGYVGCAAMPGYTTAMNEQRNLFVFNKFNRLIALQK